jgi:hypothetical protein
MAEINRTVSVDIAVSSFDITMFTYANRSTCRPLLDILCLFCEALSSDLHFLRYFKTMPVAKVNSGDGLERLRKTTKNLRKKSRFPGRESNRALRKCNLTALPLRQPARSELFQI